MAVPTPEELRFWGDRVYTYRSTDVADPTSGVVVEGPRRPKVDAAVLRQAPLFSQLDDEAADALAASMSESRLRRGQVLFHEGDSGDRLFVVVEGKVKLGRTSADGREKIGRAHV